MTDQANGSSSSIAPAPAAQAIVARMMAAHSDVHSYALAELTKIETKVARVKAAIAEQKNRSQQETQIYIETVDAALQCAAELDRAIDAIARTVDRPTLA
jgi:hypothetical protein